MAWTLVILLGIATVFLFVRVRTLGKQITRFTRTQRRRPIAAGVMPVLRRVDYHKPVILMAHRGLARYATENTGPAIALASEAGANGIEVDIRCTADHVPVLFHDRSLQVLAGRAQDVRDLSFSQLSDIAINPANRIVSVDIMLDEFATHFDHLMLDLKDVRRDSFDRDDVDCVIELVKRHDATRRVIVDSSSFDCVQYLQQNGLTASFRRPTRSPRELVDQGITHITMPAHLARKYYERNKGWGGLFATIVCQPPVDEAMWFIERDASAIITDLVEETIDALVAKGYASTKANGE
ncbi:MAG: glycerophosphodiester phosphodiesterase family protein [Planctomycetota bacterium]|nr:glycerophosphodiester phosphodiesterase family protein [Planctomycetota bacterium]